MKQKLTALRQKRGEQIALMEQSVACSNDQETGAYDAAKSEAERLGVQITDLETMGQITDVLRVGSTFLDANCHRPLAEFRTAALDEQARRSNAGAPIREHHATIMDRGDGLTGAMTDALCARYLRTAPSAQARPWVERRLPDYAREILRNCGMETHGSDSRVVTLAMQSTSDFPNLLSNFANKLLLAAYENVPAALKQICRVSSANDFKTQYRLRRGGFPPLDLVLESGEVHHGPVLEAKESYSVKTYGKIVGLSLQAILNDDLGAFQSLTSAAGQSAANFEADYLVALLAGPAGLGPAMDDGHALFDAANHRNLPASRRAPAATAAASRAFSSPSTVSPIACAASNLRNARSLASRASINGVSPATPASIASSIFPA